MERSDPPPLRSIREQLDLRHAAGLSAHAVRNTDALRRRTEEFLTEGYRQAFSVDVDRILHSRAYARYIDKTQVFYLIRNDHITHRVLHVQLVSKISRSIGRFLGLNEDLIEAIALGHDIGHTPFGHDGERFLSELCVEHGIGTFQHNVQSVHFLDLVERKGQGWNLCLQTLDGILCHDGEVHNQSLAPLPGKSFASLAAEMQAKKDRPDTELTPMSLEGCVVRMADTVSYIGRDIEDAIRLRLIRREDLPQASVRLLGDTNGTIVYHLVTDILKTSHEKGYVAFSPEVSEALRRLKQFNLDRIYLNPRMKPQTGAIRELFRRLFAEYLAAISDQRLDSVIFRGFLNGMSPEYVAGHSPAEIVRDFIAGMTDTYFIDQCPAHLRPAYIQSGGG
ncbi:MAG: HD domain-containing protein [Desulfobacterales bacterium]|jgi:dGTPase|nr:HD domain-containing protein [Desulfobacterales bacterium]